MTSKSPKPILPANGFALTLVRLLALVLILIGLGGMIANVVESLPGFDPNYPGYYFIAELLRPFLAIVGGVLIWTLSRPLARWLERC